MQTVNIFNIQHFSLHDGNGIRTVLFMKGCPLDCVWCHNPESKTVHPTLSFLREKCLSCGKCVHACERGAHAFVSGEHRIHRENCIACGRCVEACDAAALNLFGKAYTYDAIMEEIAKDDIFFGEDGGVTFSGGEPFAQAEALLALLKLCKEKGYSTCIETAGYARTEHILAAVPYTDFFLFDCKETNDENHKKYTGVSFALIRENLAALQKTNAYVVLRCPIVPGLNDRDEHFLGIRALAERFSCIRRVEFLPYHPLGESKNLAIGEEARFALGKFADKEAIKEKINRLLHDTQKYRLG